MNFDFSALNFETIDSNINAYPDMFLNQNGATFTKKVLEDLGYPAFVLCLLDAKARVFAIRSCKSNEPKSFKFSKPKGEQKGVVTISNKNLLDPLRAVTGEDWIPGKRYKVRGFWVADAKTMCFDLNEGVQEDFRPVTPSNDRRITPDTQGEKGEPKSGGKPPERESHLSLFSLAAAMETVENRKWFTHRSHSLHLPSYSSPAFSLYKEKCPFSISNRTVATMNRGQRVNIAKKSKRHTDGFILKKSPET